MKKTLLAAFLFFFAGAAFGAFEPLGFGAAAKGMGGAYTAKAEDASAVYWNPASLAWAKDRQVQTALEDVNGLGILRYGVAGYSQPGVGGGGIGFSFLRLETVGEASFFHYAENTYLFSYGHSLGSLLAIGAGLRYYEVSSVQKAGATGIDGGLLLKSPGDRVRLGFAAQNVNKPLLRWGTGAVDVLPSVERVGLLLKAGPISQISVEESWRYRDARSFRLGMEHALISGRFILRAGMHRTQGEDQWGYALGGGLKLGAVSVDYSWDHHLQLGDSQTLDLSFRFLP